MYNYICLKFGFKQTDSKSNTWMMFNLTEQKPLCDGKNIEMYGYSYQRDKQVKYRQRAIVANKYSQRIRSVWII